MRGAAFLGLLVAVCVAAPAFARDDAPYVAPSRLLVLGPDGRPLGGVLVLRTLGEAEGFPLFDPDAPVVARTEPDGFARSLPPQGRIVAWAPGLAVVLVPGGPGPAVVRLTPAESTEGRVRLAGGRPAVKVPILALPLAPTADLGHVVRTDARGTFRFPALHRGHWRLLMRRGAKRFQTLGHAEAGADLGERRPRGDTAVIGRVLDADGTHRKPVAGVGLRFRAMEGGGARSDTLVEIKTGADGSFRAGGLEPGVYEVSLLDPNWLFDHTPPRVEAEDGRAREVSTWFALRRQDVSGVVRDAKDRPLRGVKLKLVADPRTPGPPGGIGELPRTVQSDPQGRFRIRSVAPAEGYRLMASLDGFSPWISDPFPVDRARETKLKAFRMRPGWRLRVRVRDGRGVAVVGANVFATAASRPSAVEDLAWSTMVRAGGTNTAGLLDLADLPADDVLVFVRHPGFLDAQTVVPYPRVSDQRRVDVDLEPAVGMTLQVLSPEGGPKPPFRVLATTRDGQRSTAAETDERGRLRFDDLLDTATDFQVTRPGARDGVVLAEVENVVPGVEQHLEILLPTLRTVRGTVTGVDIDGPAPKVLVETLRFVPDKERYVWRAVKEVRLPGGEPEVAFEVPGLPPASYAVRAMQGGLDSGAVAVLLDRDDVGGVTLTMPNGARIAGAVLDAEGKPQIGVAVRLIRMHGEDPAPIRGGRGLRATTNERGEFLFDGLAPGLWRLEATDQRRAPDAELVRVLDGEVLVTRDLVLGAGGTLQGTVEDGEGRALDALHVYVRRFDGEEAERMVRTDGEGRFLVENLRAGAYLVRVAAGSAGRRASIEALAEVEAGATVRVDFTARQEGVIAGTVLRGGRPVSGAIIDLLHEPNGEEEGALKRYRARTDAGGSFEIGSLAPGAYRVQIQSGAWRTEQGLELVEGDRLQLDLEAFEGRLRGTVVTRDGDPVPGAHVTAWPAAPDGSTPGVAAFVGEGRCDPRGAFVLRGLPVGAYTLTVSAPGLPPGRLANVEADLPGADFTVEVVLGRGGDVDLSVVDDTGRGVTGARIWLEDTEGRALHRYAYVSGAGGRIRIEGVPPGKVRLRVYARGMGRPALRTLDVQEGGSTPVSVALRPGGTLRLVVTGEGSDPLGRARIDVLRAGTGEVLASRRPLSPIRLPAPWGYVPRTGVVDIPDLEEGDYVARVSAGRGYERADVPVSVKAGLLSTVRVTLAPAGR